MTPAPISRDSIRAIVVDLDDTLYPERQYVFSGYQAVAEFLAGKVSLLRDPYEIMVELFDSPDRGRVFDRLLEEAGLEDKALVQKMIEVYRAHQPQLTLFDDAARFLDQVGGKYLLGLVSDGFLQVQRRKLAVLNVADKFDRIVLTDQWSRQYWKPHPRAFEELQSRFGAGGSEILYVADNPRKDFIAPRALGWLAIQVRRVDGIYSTEKPPASGHPHAVVSSFDALNL